MKTVFFHEIETTNADTTSVILPISDPAYIFGRLSCIDSAGGLIGAYVLEAVLSTPSETLTLDTSTVSAIHVLDESQSVTFTIDSNKLQVDLKGIEAVTLLWTFDLTLLHI